MEIKMCPPSRTVHNTHLGAYNNTLHDLIDIENRYFCVYHMSFYLI